MNYKEKINIFESVFFKKMVWYGGVIPHLIFFVPIISNRMFWAKVLSTVILFIIAKSNDSDFFKNIKSNTKNVKLELLIHIFIIIFFLRFNSYFIELNVSSFFNLKMDYFDIVYDFRNIYLILAWLIFAPISEELVFKYALFFDYIKSGNFSKNKLNYYIFFSIYFFLIIHFDQFFTKYFFGIVLVLLIYASFTTFLYIKTYNIIYCIWAHFIFNLIPIIIYNFNIIKSLNRIYYRLIEVNFNILFLFLINVFFISYIYYFFKKVIIKQKNSLVN